MLNIFDSHGLMLMISFSDVIRMPAFEEIEAQINEAHWDRDALIKHLVSLSTEEVDISFVYQEILDMLDRIEVCVYNFKFRGMMMCLLDALSKLCDVKDIKVLKGLEHDVLLCLQEEEIRMADLAT